MVDDGGRILQRWFAAPKNILAALEEEYTVNAFGGEERHEPHAMFQRDGAAWRVSAVGQNGELTRVREISVATVPRLPPDVPSDRSPTEVGRRFHEELLDLLGADPVAVTCEDCGIEPFLAYDEEEATEFAEEHAVREGHSPDVGT